MCPLCWQHFRRLSAISAISLLSSAASAEVLVYDGFPINGNGVTGAYSADNAKKLTDQTLSNANILGFSDNRWQSGTGVIYSYTSGLSLP